MREMGERTRGSEFMFWPRRPADVLILVGKTRWSALFWELLCRGRPCSSYNMSPLNRGNLHRVPMSILRCHNGVLLGVIGVLHPSAAALLSAVMPLDTGGLISLAAIGSTTTLLVLWHGIRGGFGVWSLLVSTSMQSYPHFSCFLLSALPGFCNPEQP